MNASPGLNGAANNPFRSFWMAGFECADHLNAWGNRVDFLALTDHLNQLNEDYIRLKSVNIFTVREGLRWSQVEIAPYQYDFTALGHLLDAGQRHGIQQVWDLCHFGYPADLSPLHPHFTDRFVGLCTAFATFCLPHYGQEPLIVTPFNEVSFLSWLGGEVGGTAPYCVGGGWQVKYAIMRAYIRGVQALKHLDAGILILPTEPLVNVVPPVYASSDDLADAHATHQDQFQAMDMLCGRICPELGGRPEYLDIMGYNYYPNNQWETGFEINIPWKNEQDDPRWRPLSALMAEAHQRYGKPVVLTETSHAGEERAAWMDFIGLQASDMLAAGMPLLGVCLYPIIDRPDWDRPDEWHHSGLWDHTNTGGRPNRVLNEEYHQALLRAQDKVGRVRSADQPGPQKESPVAGLMEGPSVPINF